MRTVRHVKPTEVIEPDIPVFEEMPDIRLPCICPGGWQLDEDRGLALLRGVNEALKRSVPAADLVRLWEEAGWKAIDLKVIGPRSEPKRERYIVTEGDRVLCPECFRDSLDDQDWATHAYTGVSRLAGSCDCCGE